MILFSDVWICVISFLFKYNDFLLLMADFLEHPFHLGKISDDGSNAKDKESK